MTKNEILESLGFSKEYITILEDTNMNSFDQVSESPIEYEIETEHVVSSTSFVFSSNYE